MLLQLGREERKRVRSCQPVIRYVNLQCLSPKLHRRVRHSEVTFLRVFKWLLSLRGWIVFPQNSCMEVLIPSTSECEHIWRWHLQRSDWVKNEFLHPYDRSNKRKFGHRVKIACSSVRQGKKPQRKQLRWHLDLRPLVSRTVRKLTSVG